MSTAITFIPQHQQPFTLEQAMLLEVDMLVAEVARLQNSISHLQRTQEELRSFLEEDPEGDDDGELEKAVQENDVTIASQRERITLIKVALLNKVGEGGMKHMGLEDVGPHQGATQRADQARRSNGVAEADPTSEEGDEAGMHL